MLTYFTFTDNDEIHHIGYRLPGVPHVFVSAGTATSLSAAEAECARLNELQVVERRTDLVRAANFLPLDLGKEN